MDSSLQLICEVTLLVTAIFMNITRKNTSVVSIYAVQSLALVVMLTGQAFQLKSIDLYLLALAMLAVKVIFVPHLFRSFIKRRHEPISSGTYLSSSLTLATLLFLVIFVQSGVFAPASLSTSSPILLLIDSGLMSFFMAVNRKGAILQIIGILSLENSIFAMGHFLDPRMAGSLELGILFDVLFWAIIASTYLRMVYSHNRSLDVASLRKLKQ